MPPPIVANSASTVNRDLDLLGNNLFCGDIVCDEIYSADITSSGRLLGVTAAVSGQSTLGNVSCNNLAANGAVTVGSTLAVTDSVSCEDIYVSGMIDASSASSCNLNNVACVEIAVSGSSTLHETNINGDCTIVGTLYADNIANNTGWISGHETVNVDIDGATWSSQCQFNFLSNHHGSVDLDLVCVDVGGYDYAGKFLLSKSHDASSTPSIYTMGSSSSTNGVTIAVRWLANQNPTLRLASLIGNPASLPGVHIDVRYRFYKNP